ncbi:MAG: hypothetical protein ACRDJM_08550, partial [Actinomycetota bacterium]
MLCKLIVVVGITVPGAAAVPGEGIYVLDSMASTSSWSGEVIAGVSVWIPDPANGRWTIAVEPSCRRSWDA